MRYVAPLILAFITLIALGYIAYSIYPEIRTIPIVLTRMVEERETRTVKKMVKVNGQMVEAEVEEEFITQRPVADSQQHEIAPSLVDKLRFIVVAGVLVIFGLYMVITLVLWTRDKFTKRANSSDVQDTRKRVDGIMTFCTGIAVGVIGGNSVFPPTEWQKAQRTPKVSAKQSSDASVPPFEPPLNRTSPPDAVDAVTPSVKHQLNEELEKAMGR